MVARNTSAVCGSASNEGRCAHMVGAYREHRELLTL